MARRGTRTTRSALALAAVAAFCFGPVGLGWTKTETREQLEKTAKVWKQPHNFRVAGSQFAVDTISQGGDQWQVRATERDGSSALFAAKDQGEEVAYGINYDSSRSHWKPPCKTRVYATGITDGDDPEWTLRVEGPGHGTSPQQISVTGKGLGDIVYDAALAVERRLKRSLFWSYALDAKGRGDGWTPWVRQGLGLKYAPEESDINAKFNIFQAEAGENQTLNLDWEALLRGRLTGLSSKRGGRILSTDPQYTLRMTKGGLDAGAKANAKLGTSFGVTAHVSPEGNYQAQGYGEWNGKRELVDGLVVGADVKATAQEGVVTLQPLGATAAMDLSKLAPKVAGENSMLGLRARYKLGDEKPSLGAVGSFRPKKVQEVLASGGVQYTQEGDTSGTLRLTAEDLKGVDARYELSGGGSAGLRQAAEVRMPRVDFGGGSQLRFTGKFYKGKDWGEEPRVQLGAQYEGKVTVLGKSLDLGGESAGFDSGRSLLDELGRGWTSPEARKARNTAKVVRRRAEGDFGEARHWLEK